MPRYCMPLACCALMLHLFTGCAEQPSQPPFAKSRVIILTDIGGDPDDQQSLVRLLLYSNELDIEGIVVTGRVVRDMGPVIRTDLVRSRIYAYGQVRDNLIQHADGWPTVDFLMTRLKNGHHMPKRLFDRDTRKLTHMPAEEKIGRDINSDGAHWIIHQADQPDPRPLWICIWGTANDLAQALWQVRETRTPEELRTFVSKLRVYHIAYQDHTNRWLQENFPDLWTIQTSVPASDQLPFPWGTYKGIYEHGDTELSSATWTQEHIQRNHGPLGALYPRAYPYFKEGDSPSFMYLLPNGLNAPEHPGWGSWGGRFQGTAPMFTDVITSHIDTTDARHPDFRKDALMTVARWRRAFQNDFQARMDWCVEPRDRVNHNPVVVVNGQAGRNILYMNAQPGTSLALNADGSTDPDGDMLTYRWWQYEEADNYKNRVEISGASTPQCTVSIPTDAQGHTIHIILEITDSGAPLLYAWRRVVITVEN